MKVLKLKLVILLLIIYIFVPLGGYAQRGPFCAKVLTVNGRASVKRADTGKTETLKGGEDLFKKDYILCERGCVEVTIRYCNWGPTPIYRKTRMYVPTCKHIPFSRQGGEKGKGEIIVTPYEGEMIRPEKFSLKWQPDKAQSHIYITVKVDSGAEVFFRRKISNHKGFYRSHDLIDSLKRAQQTGKSILEVRLSGTNRNGKETLFSAMVFRLLSLDDQRKLKADLKELNGSDRIFKAIERALTFSSYDLYTEAASEMETALQLALGENANSQQIPVLKEWAITLNYNAYNENRARQLCSTIPAKQLPPICIKLSKE